MLTGVELRVLLVCLVSCCLFIITCILLLHAVQISSPVRQTVLVVMEQHVAIQEQEGITVRVSQATLVLTVSMRPMNVY